MIINLVVLTLLGWLAFLAVRSLKRRGVGWPWWVVLGVCLAIGFALGDWFGFHFEYQLSLRFRVFSFPLPSAFFVLESYPDGEERWTDFITPAPWLFAASNVVLFIFVSVYPVWLAHTLWRFVRGQSKAKVASDSA